MRVTDAGRREDPFKCDHDSESWSSLTIPNKLSTAVGV